MDGGLLVLPDLNGSPVAFIQEDGSVSGDGQSRMGAVKAGIFSGFSRHGQNMLLQRGSMSGWDGSG